MIKCGNRAHGWPPHIYHASVADVRACCAGEAVAALDETGAAILGRSGGVLGRSGAAWRARVDAAWQAEVVRQDFFNGEVDVIRAEKVKFYRRRWIRRRDINLEVLW